MFQNISNRRLPDVFLHSIPNIVAYMSAWGWGDRILLAGGIPRMSQAAGLPTGGISMTPLPRYKPDNYTLMGSNDQNVFIATSNTFLCAADFLKYMQAER